MTRRRVLYLAPWVDYGGSDKGTIDWFRWLDRSRFEASLVTTQPSANRRLDEIRPYASEAWALPDLMGGQHMPTFIFDFIATRGIEVVHIMNSRLGYELLPDLATLPHPPKVVVQLHVEEQDRSGYVRLVCRRYGNLVDAFSVSSRHLAAAVEGYEVPPARIHVIPTGVDAEEEFSPDRVRPIEGFDPDITHVLYPGRLVPQKDPLLMADALARAIGQGANLRVHVVGEGELEPALRARLGELGVAQHVAFHPSTPDLAGWYAACDLLLMTSVFEGVPYVAYEAMAMGLPVVAPALPGNVELFGGQDHGTLIDPRDDADAYARALTELAASRERRAAIGVRSRERTRSELSVQAMAKAHEDLYEGLLATAAQPEPTIGLALYQPSPRPARFSRLSPADEPPLVTTITPCFNHGRFLPECLAAIREQTHGALELIVVDDASTDPDTLRVLAELGEAPDVTLIRQERNSGPSAARNAALERASGRFVLPVDADNILVPDAIERMLGQLLQAGEDVGFVYPSQQYFGTRRDFHLAPEYDMSALLEGNYCDTGSLFDADVFGVHGIRFDEDIKLGHEDWMLALQLAALGVRGEPARYPTVFHRKAGFTRSDAVEYQNETFLKAIRGQLPELFGGGHGTWGRYGWYAGAPVSIKAQWSPGVSIVALAPVAGAEAAERLRRRVGQQTCADFEVLARCDSELQPLPGGARIRRIPASLALDPARALDDGLRAARAPIVIMTAGSGSSLLEDPALIEKLMRSVLARPELEVVVLADAPGAHRYPMQVLSPAETMGLRPHTVVLHRERIGTKLPPALTAGRDTPLDDLVEALAELAVEWRHAPAGMEIAARNGATAGVRLAGRAPAANRRRVQLNEQALPAIPALPWDHVRRWTMNESWTPPETLFLVRHRRLGGDERIVTNDRKPPTGYAIEWDLGMVQRFQPPGTAELRRGGAEPYYAIADTDEGAPILREPQHPDYLGCVEEAPLPLFMGLETAFHPASNRWVLVNGIDDPLLAEVTDRRFLGYVEAYPNLPRLAPLPSHRHGLRPLLRTVDRAARRHRYSVEDAPAGDLSAELGSVHTRPGPGLIPLFIADDRIVLDEPAVAGGRVAWARWAVAPLAWPDAGPVQPRLRATARRSLDAVRHGAAAAPQTGRVAGYLWEEGGPSRRPIFAATHPVTGDQLVTAWPAEASEMGYGAPRRLGFVSTKLSFTGSLSPAPVAIPWTRYFGRGVRY